jgi:hypothetical protein
MNEFDFIKNKELKLTLENSIEYIYALFEESKKGEQKQLYKEETYRVIILYIISAIEAVLLYFYKERKEKIEYLEYKFVQSVSKNYIHKEKKDLPVVIAVQEKKEREEHQIGLYDLVILFRDKKLINLKTSKNILKLNNIRNTFHFSKPRIQKCDLKDVESALNLLVYVLQKFPKSLTLK